MCCTTNGASFRPSDEPTGSRERPFFVALQKQIKENISITVFYCPPLSQFGMHLCVLTVYT
jgi:hypothetical protein